MNSGYVYKTENGKKVFEHISVMEALLGRKLEPNEVVHHINGIKCDNRPENLQIMDRADHTRMHRLGAVASPKTLSKFTEARKGKPNANRKLSEDNVKDIISRIQSGESYKSIARIYNVGDNCIRRIRLGQNYRDIIEKYAPEMLSENETKVDGLPNPSIRKFTDEEVSKIRIMLMKGNSLRSIGKEFGVNYSTIADIRDGRSYTDVPQPELIAEFHEFNNIRDLADIMLLSPIPEENNPIESLLNDYHLLPSRNAIIIFRLMQRALNGDAEDAVLLFALSSFDYLIDKLIIENSQLGLYSSSDGDILCQK